MSIRKPQFMPNSPSKTHPEEEEDDPKKEVPPSMFADASAMKEKLKQSMMKPQYDVCNFYKTKGFCQKVARHPKFDASTLSVIAFNALWMWIDTDLNGAPTILDAEPVFQVAEHFFCAYFSFEWVMRFGAFQRKRDGCRDAWFVFDSFMVVMMVGETWVLTAIMLVSGGGGSGGGLGNASILRLLRLLRLSRMARMAKLLRAMPELLILIKGMVSAMRSVFFTLLLLGILLYIFAIAFRQLTDGSAAGKKYFSTVLVAMHTLLRDGTFMDGLGNVVQDLLAETGGWVLVLVFYVFCFLAAATVMNMLIGVLCDVVSAVAATEKESITVAMVKDGFLEILTKGGLDEDGDNMISRKEFNSILDHKEAVQLLDRVAVDVYALVDLADWIFEPDEDGEETKMEFVDFMELVLSLRGTNNATVKDIVDLRKFIECSLKKMEDRLEDRLTGRSKSRRNTQASARGSTDAQSLRAQLPCACAIGAADDPMPPPPPGPVPEPPAPMCPQAARIQGFLSTAARDLEKLASGLSADAFVLQDATSSKRVDDRSAFRKRSVTNETIVDPSQDILAAETPALSQNFALRIAAESVADPDRDASASETSPRPQQVKDVVLATRSEDFGIYRRRSGNQELTGRHSQNSSASQKQSASPPAAMPPPAVAAPCPKARTGSPTSFGDFAAGTGQRLSDSTRQRLEEVHLGAVADLISTELGVYALEDLAYLRPEDVSASSLRPVQRHRLLELIGAIGRGATSVDKPTCLDRPARSDDHDSPHLRNAALGSPWQADGDPSGLAPHPDAVAAARGRFAVQANDVRQSVTQGCGGQNPCHQFGDKSSQPPSSSCHSNKASLKARLEKLTKEMVALANDIQDVRNQPPVPVRLSRDHRANTVVSVS